MSAGKFDLVNEDNLLQGCRKQDRKAQKALYEKYASRMFSVCMRYSKSREEAEDLLQEGFVTVFSKIDTFGSSGSLEGWMRRIFVNTALMELRKGNVLRDAVEVNDRARGISSGDDILSGIGGRDIVKMISAMPDGFRIVFNMSVIEGYTHQEIARELGISEGTSRSQLSRARIWLQERLREKRNRR
ncbi:MAG TPA: sigma-70 family RNA polymerase sigma factor [Candidatus Coprenecus pullistercoris]|nr:sigma-70 family RNA polymerase sigma factor [Candidatus Coprenecus pullistercoris]